MNKPDPIQIPEGFSVKHIHMIAICGTAMGALASMLKEMGYSITGSDQNVYPPMSDFLRSKGITIFQGFKAEHLHHKPDLVIVGNAVSRDNAEAVAMRGMGLSYCSMPQAVNHFVAKEKGQILVTGTHGKTTTSSFIAWMLHSAGLEPTFLIGGILSNFKSNYVLGNGRWVVLEGDEYDTAFFDKGPKFLHYSPDLAILTSIEFDHADIFKDLDHVKQAFGALIDKLTDQARLLVFDNDPNISDLLRQHQRKTAYYGCKNSSEWRLGNIRIEPPMTHFQVYHAGHHYGDFQTKMIGEHNLLNLLAGIAAGHYLGIDIADTAAALASFAGIRRRQEVRGIKNDIIVIDDFAHHPTAVKATVKAVKAFYSRNRLVAVFEPRTNSSRRNVFQSRYPETFDAADVVCVREAPLLEKIPPDKRFSSRKLVSDLSERGLDAHFFEDTDGIIAYLAKNARPGDIILIMSNGGFDNIHQRLLDSL